jgi:cytochrome c553
MVATELLAGSVDDDAHMAVAAYVAKYATKTADSTGALAYRLNRGSEIARLRVNDHQRRLVETAWSLGGRKELADLRLRRCAHAFGYRGHVVTKSTRYSTTFSALRAVRADYQRARDEPGAAPSEVLHYGFAGRGYDDPGLGMLAFHLAQLATTHGEEPMEKAGEDGTGDG